MYILDTCMNYKCQKTPSHNQQILFLQMVKSFLILFVSIRNRWVIEWSHQVIPTQVQGQQSIHSSPRTTWHPFHPAVVPLTSQTSTKMIKGIPYHFRWRACRWWYQWMARKTKKRIQGEVLNVCFGTYT